MRKKWAYVIIFVVLTLAAWSGWEIFKAFETEKDVGQYSKYVSPIDPQLDEKLIKNVAKMQNKILVEKSEIAPITE